jgi:phospholipase C
MSTINRRGFLKAGAAGLALSALPLSIQRALAIQANNVTGTINDIEHIVIVMQENRSFEHYFGTMPGVRGYSDRFTIPQASGNSVFAQQGASGIVPAFYMNPSTTQAMYVGGDHGWASQHAAWNNGIMNDWPAAKNSVGGDSAAASAASMGYLMEQDLPFRRALAQAYTLCDHYHCSVHGPTYPNRLFAQTGTNGAVAGTAVIDTEGTWALAGGTAAQGLTWTTTAERLEAAGISWKYYWDPADPGAFNMHAGFQQYRQIIANIAAAQGITVAQAAEIVYTSSMETNPLYGPLFKGVGNTSPGAGTEAILADIANGTLPQVSWLMGPYLMSEHPEYSTSIQGEWILQQLFEALTSNPEVWSKTVLLVHWDENDHYFDHMPPPCPPSPNGTDANGNVVYAGKSTVSTANEYLTMGAPAADPDQHAESGAVIGPGVRVPMMVVSPWSVGGWVNSQVFDHTSTLRLIEARFGLQETNITPWRRAVMGDMTSCFNFTTPNELTTVTPGPTMPLSAAQANAAATANKALPVPTAPAFTPATPNLPAQPLQLRNSRALPYNLHTSANVDTADGLVWLTFENTGTQGAVFHVYDKLNLGNIPRRYTVEAGKEISDSWSVTTNTPANQYDLWVLGPNGYHRHFTGSLAELAGTAPAPEVRVCYDHTNNAVYLTIMNVGTAQAQLTVTDNAYGLGGPWTYTVDPGMQVEPYWTLAGSQSWYDFTMTLNSSTTYQRRFAGRVETGKDGVSDPAMGSATGVA